MALRMPVNLRLPLFRHIFLVLLIGMICLYCQPSLRSENEPKSQNRQNLMRGPLRISANETVSKERGKIVEASGNVDVWYEMESGDVITSFSQFARYNEEVGEGEVWGSPRAYWMRKDPKLPQTTLVAERILLKIRDSELLAKGNVSVFQASSTLKADEVLFSNLEKRITARGGKPEFLIHEDQHRTRISAKEIIALTEKKEIKFSQRVSGTVLLLTQR